MGMTDSQFKGFLRLLIDMIEDILSTMQAGKEKDKLQRIADILQKTIED